MNKNYTTWLTHAAQGALVGVVFLWLIGGADAYLGAALALGYHFGIREWPVMRGTFGKRDRVMMWDTVLDFVSPFVGLMIVFIAARVI